MKDKHHDITSMRNLKKNTRELIYKTEKDSQTFIYLFGLFLLLLWATPAAHGGSQAGG